MVELFKVNIVKSTSANLVWFVVVIFLLALSFLGGSSRHDHAQVIMLRPIAVLSLFFALGSLQRKTLSEFWALALLMLALIVWALLQLIPLPGEVWQELPGRKAISDLDQAVYGHAIARPISMSPAAGWSALAALAVPAAALVMAIAFNFSSKLLLGFVALLGLTNVIFGFIQTASGGAGALYIYRVSNRNGPTGLFANENHMGAFLAITILVFAKLLIDCIRERRSQVFIYILGLSIPMTFLALLINGSRAGIVLGLFASLGALLMFWISVQAKAPNSSESPKRGRRTQGHGKKRLPLGTITFASAAVAFVILLGVFLSLDRIPGLESAVNEDPMEQLRVQLLAPLFEMIKSYWLLGIGFGSFSAAYAQYEPIEIAGPSYVNQAHNDWAQLIIEGGLPAIVIFSALMILLTKRLFALARKGQTQWPSLVFWAFSFAIIAAASVVDYPLRTAIFQASAIWLICALLVHPSGDLATGQRCSSER